MDNKILLQDLSNGVSQRSGLAKRESDNFVRNFFAVIEQYLQEDKIVKVKGFGTFKIVEVSGRDSVNVNTGERFHIKGHSKITFTPDADLRDYVNRPFADFETIILNDGVDLKAMEYVADTEDIAEDLEAHTEAAPETPAAPTEAAPEGPATPTEAAPEGPATPTEAAPEGSATPTEAAPEGSATPTEAAPEGSATPTEAAPEGSATPTEAAPEGAVAPSEVVPEAPAAPTEAVPEATAAPAEDVDEDAALDDSFEKTRRCTVIMDGTMGVGTTDDLQDDWVEKTICMPHPFIEGVHILDHTPTEIDATAEEPAVADGPVTAEEPEADDEPVAVEEPVADDEPVAVEEPVAAEEPVTAEEPVADDELSTDGMDESATAAVYDDSYSSFNDNTDNEQNTGFCSSESEDIEEPVLKGISEQNALADSSVDSLMEEPIEPLSEEPSKPLMEEPIVPLAEDLSEPLMEEPIVPLAEEPSQPPMEDPTEPSTEEPTEPSIEAPLTEGPSNGDTDSSSSDAPSSAEPVEPDPKPVSPAVPERRERPRVVASSRDMIKPRYVVSHSYSRGSVSEEPTSVGDEGTSVWKSIGKAVLIILLMLASYLVGASHLFGSNCDHPKHKVPAQTSVPAKPAAKTESSKSEPAKAVEDPADVQDEEVEDAYTQGLKTSVPAANAAQPSNEKKPAKGKEATAPVPQKSQAVNIPVPKDGPATASSADASGFPQVKGGAYEIVGVKCTHVLKKGETISKLSRTYLGGLAMNEYIIKINNLRSPDMVEPGQTLKIPELRKK